jgi:hypothetical protein
VYRVLHAARFLRPPGSPFWLTVPLEGRGTTKDVNRGHYRDTSNRRHKRDSQEPSHRFSL